MLKMMPFCKHLGSEEDTWVTFLSSLYYLQHMPAFFCCISINPKYLGVSKPILKHKLTALGAFSASNQLA
tara:strand:+ start:228 stop:437 length:210 start_codon:yes stop_codon:yes gene_type:complete